MDIFTENRHVANTKPLIMFCWEKLLTLYHFSVKYHAAMCYNTSDRIASKKIHIFLILVK